MSKKLHGAPVITHFLKNIGFGNMKAGVGTTAIASAIIGAIVVAGAGAIYTKKITKEKR